MDLKEILAPSKMSKFLGEERLSINLSSENYSICDPAIEKNLLSQTVKIRQELTQNLLQSNDEDIIKAQLAKLQLRTFLNLGDSLKSPIENSKKLQAAYNNLILILEDGIKNNDGNKKEYFSKTLEFFKKVFENYNFVDGQVEIPKNEDLIKVLFKKMSETVQDEVKTNVPKIEQNIKSSSNKKFLPFVVLGAIMVGVVAFIIKKVNFSARNKSTPETKKPLDTLINYNLSKNLNSTFLKFKR